MAERSALDPMPHDDLATGQRWRRRGCDALAMAGGALLAAILVGWGDMAPLAAGFAVLWWAAVIVIVRSDLDHFIIPDQASLGIALLGLGQAATSGAWSGASIADVIGDSGAALLGGAAGFALFWLVQRTYRWASGREGLGFGDVKLAGACAVWLSAQDAVIALEIAALAAIAMLLARRRGRPVRDVAVPFGAFMAPAAWLAFVAGPVLHPLLDRLA